LYAWFKTDCLASFGFKFGNKHEKTTTPIREKKQQQAVTRAKQKVRIIVLCGLCVCFCCRCLLLSQNIKNEEHFGEKKLKRNHLFIYCKFLLFHFMFDPWRIAEVSWEGPSLYRARAATDGGP
jgi:hypothetical protein